MPPRERRIQRARENPKDVSFRDLYRIYEDHGFRVRSGKGSHYVATFPDTRIRNTFPRQNPMRRVYVIKALEAIEELTDLGLIKE